MGWSPSRVGRNSTSRLPRVFVCPGTPAPRVLRVLLHSAAGPHSLFGQLDSMGYTVEPPLDLHPSQEATYMGGFITEHYGSLPNVYAMQVCLWGCIPPNVELLLLLLLLVESGRGWDPQIEVGAGYRGLEERITQTGVDIGQAMGHFFTHFFKEVL